MYDPDVLRSKKRMNGSRRADPKESRGNLHSLHGMLEKGDTQLVGAEDSNILGLRSEPLFLHLSALLLC